jgi:hypothetical protein
MKRSISNVQTIVQESVVSAVFGVVLSLCGYHTQIADAKKGQHNGSTSKDTTPDNTSITTNSAYSSNTEIKNVV